MEVLIADLVKAIIIGYLAYHIFKNKKEIKRLKDKESNYSKNSSSSN